MSESICTYEISLPLEWGAIRISYSLGKWEGREGERKEHIARDLY